MRCTLYFLLFTICYLKTSRLLGMPIYILRRGNSYIFPPPTTNIDCDNEQDSLLVFITICYRWGRLGRGKMLWVTIGWRNLRATTDKSSILPIKRSYPEMQYWREWWFLPFLSILLFVAFTDKINCEHIYLNASMWIQQSLRFLDLLELLFVFVDKTIQHTEVWFWETVLI